MMIQVGDRLPKPILVARHNLRLRRTHRGQRDSRTILVGSGFSDVCCPWTIRRQAASAAEDRTRLWTVRGRGLNTVWDKLRSWSRTGQCYGQLAGRCGPCSSHFANTALAIAWTIRRMLCGLSTGRQPGRCASAKRTASWIPAAIAGTLPGCYANWCADIRRCCVSCFPATAQTLRGSCPAIARTIHQTLGGCCADIPWTRTGRGLVMDWMRRRSSCRPFASIGSDAIRPLPGCWPNNTRRLPG